MFAALLLLLLVILAGQNTFTGFLAGLFQSRPPCVRMRQAVDRGAHQSLIGRAASERGTPVRVDLTVGNYPTTAEDQLVLTIVLSNITVGTVPFVYSGGIPVNNPTPDGFGIVVGNTALPGVGQSTGFIPESNIRLLVPLQSCVEIVTLSVSELQQFGIQEGSVLRAYYRNGNSGQVTVTPGTIYPDLGLWVGVAESRSAVVPINIP